MFPLGSAAKKGNNVATFEIGDYVIADRARDDSWVGYTWKVIGFSLNMFGESLVRVENIETGDRTVFYPWELSWEDGTRPAEM